MNQLAWIVVKFSALIASSMCAFASASGKERLAGRRNETKTKRSTPAAFDASTRLSCPCSSTDSIESPACRDKVDDAVEMTAFTPLQAPASEPVSFKSPTHSSTPHFSRDATFSGELVVRTSALTFSPRFANRRQISVPSRPVAPTTRIILTSSVEQTIPVSSNGYDREPTRRRRQAENFTFASSWSSHRQFGTHRNSEITIWLLMGQENLQHSDG